MIENITTTTREITETIASYTAFDGTKFDTKKECANYEFKKSRYGGIGNNEWHIVNSEDELRSLIEDYAVLIDEMSYCVSMNGEWVSQVVKDNRGVPVAKKIGEHYKYIYEYSFDKLNIVYPTMVAFGWDDYEDYSPFKINVNTLDYEIATKTDKLKYISEIIDKLKTAKNSLNK